MIVGASKRVLAGALLSFGVVGFFTGLVLVPFGIALTISADHSHRSAWPCDFVGLGTGPIVLLSGDAFAADPPSASVPDFVAGVHLVVAGLALWSSIGRRHPEDIRH